MELLKISRGTIFILMMTARFKAFRMLGKSSRCTSTRMVELTLLGWKGPMQARKTLKINSLLTLRKKI